MNFIAELMLKGLTQSVIWKCTKCQHEWQGRINQKYEKCDWCGSSGKILGPAYGVKLELCGKFKRH